MDINEFALAYPDLFRMLNDSVSTYMDSQSLTIDSSIGSLDDTVEAILQQAEQIVPPPDSYQAYEPAIPVQMMPYRGYGWDYGSHGDDWRRRRPRRDFDLRDIIRLIFMRQLYDRRGHRGY